MSAYVTSIEGIIQNEDGELLYETLELGSQGQGWWRAEDVLLHAQEVVKALEKRFPFCEIVMVIDNSPAHRKYDKDSLKVEHLNKHAGGKQPLLRSSLVRIFRKVTNFKHGMDWSQAQFEEHSLSVPFNQEMNDVVSQRKGAIVRKTPKGTQRILQERLDKFGIGCEYLKQMSLTDQRAYLKSQPDFQNTQTQLEDWINNHQNSISTCIYLPRFHPELNIIGLCVLLVECMLFKFTFFVEYWWGILKKYVQARNSGKLQDLKKNFEDAVEKYNTAELMAKIEELVHKYEILYQSHDLPKKDQNENSTHHVAVSSKDVNLLYNNYVQQHANER